MGNFQFSNIFGDPFAVVTLSIAIVRCAPWFFSLVHNNPLLICTAFHAFVSFCFFANIVLWFSLRAAAALRCLATLFSFSLTIQTDWLGSCTSASDHRRGASKHQKLHLVGGCAQLCGYNRHHHRRRLQ